MTEEQRKTLIELYAQYVDGKPQGERLYTAFYTNIVRNHPRTDLASLEMTDVFGALDSRERNQ